MMAVGTPLFEILDLAPGERVATGQFRVDVECPWFRGHFPGYPILPGAAQIRMVHDLLERLLGRPVRLTGIARTKFISRVLPGALLAFRIDVALSLDRARWSIADGPAAVSQGEVRFTVRA
jgi:3-hydroxymyristoyl/3-hydroxydecanoyl-(acyl carrier protein) dehydratase